MPRHPETCQEGDGKLEDEGGNMRREGDKAQVEHPATEHEVIKHIIEHPFQRQVQAATEAVTEQVQGYDLPEWRIEEVNDRGQQLLDAFLYVFNRIHRTQIN